MTTPIKIILGGAPHSGKSCLRYALKKAIMQEYPQAPYPYVITACPDGEGAWFHETAAANPALSDHLRIENKTGFTDEHADRYANAVEKCSLPLTFIDLGGRIDEKNEKICKHSTHAILIASDPSKLNDWKEFCHKLGITILAEIESAYDDPTDKILVLEDDGVHRGSIHCLELGDPSLHLRPTVQALAKVITSLISTHIHAPSMSTYTIELKENNTLLQVNWGKPATNDQIVQEVDARLRQLKESGILSGGPLIRINGPASLSIAMVISHHLASLYETVAIFDPPLGKYVVVFNSSGSHPLGNVID